MNTISRINNKLAALAAGVAVGLAAGAPVMADDTEILVGAALPAGKPNVLFILDTSGSMSSEVVVGEDYDPEVTYTGTCDVGRIYWSLEGAGSIDLPDCAQGTWINREAMRCNAAIVALASEGRFRDRYAQWDTSVEPNFWNVVAFQNAGLPVQGRDRLTECRADFGRHGDIGGAELFPTDGENGPWGDSEALAIDWDNTGNTYTFYDANYLNWIQESGAETVVSTRMEELKGVMSDVLTNLTGVNTGLMRFSTNSQGGMVLHELALNEENRDSLLGSVASLSPNGGTPLAETLYEAALYFGGGPVDFGLTSTGDNSSPLPSVPESRIGDNYRSPIELQCQRNYVILLTDGFPAGDSDAYNNRIELLPGFTGPCEGSCLDELSGYMAALDQRPGLEGPQTVETFTIGFHTDQPLLLDTATGAVPLRDDDGTILRDDRGEPLTRPGYFIANDQRELMTAFDDILATIQLEGESFTAPSLSVDLQNRLTNRDDIFLAVFQPPPAGEPHWEGNLKKYRIGRPEGASSDSIPTILDADGDAAVDEDGVFLAGARSFWSTGEDGPVVTEGGFVGTLTADRNIYTNLAGTDLTADGNRVLEANDALTADLLGATEARRDAVIRWARGVVSVDSDIEARPTIGDPLHSEPTLLAYSGDRYTLFLSTNAGFLHALDPESETTGITDIERFAFIPRDLLGRLGTLALNDPNPDDRDRTDAGYGLDGPLRLWIDETSRNGVVDSGDRAYLYVGMRRGGRNYYALDVTSIDSPRLLWTIRGGTGEFAELGQTWSSPVVSKIRLDGETKQVLIFAGGNDENQDARDRPATDDDMGRAIFIVDALTGERLWWASIRDEADLTLSDMTHSIPSDLRVIDTDQDGFDDRIYVGDTKAQVWRFDIDDDGVITGDVFASLGGEDESGNRKIYYPPSVTRVIDESGTFLTISVGTGHRAHPLETQVDDAFFMLRDINPFTAPVNAGGFVEYPAPIEIDQLLDITNNANPDGNDLAARAGWFIEFVTAGEKNISAPLAVLDRVFFTTYLPTSPQPSCRPASVLGSGRLYAVDILSGRPITYFDQPTPDERFQDLPQGGMPPAPTLVFTEPPCDDCEPSEQPVSEITLLVGTQALPSTIVNVPVQTYWVQEDVDK